MLQFYFLNPFDIPRRKFRKIILNHAGVCEITILKSLGTNIEYDASRYVTFETGVIFRLCYINI